MHSSEVALRKLLLDPEDHTYVCVMGIGPADNRLVRLTGAVERSDFRTLV